MLEGKLKGRINVNFSNFVQMYVVVAMTSRVYELGMSCLNKLGKDKSNQDLKAWQAYGEMFADDDICLEDFTKYAGEYYNHFAHSSFGPMEQAKIIHNELEREGFFELKRREQNLTHIING